MKLPLHEFSFVEATAPAEIQRELFKGQRPLDRTAIPSNNTEPFHLPQKFLVPQAVKLRVVKEQTIIKI